MGVEVDDEGGLPKSSGAVVIRSRVKEAFYADMRTHMDE
jgi:hypothetical protein